MRLLFVLLVLGAEPVFAERAPLDEPHQRAHAHQHQQQHPEPEEEGAREERAQPLEEAHRGGAHQQREPGVKVRLREGHRAQPLGGDADGSDGRVELALRDPGDGLVHRGHGHQLDLEARRRGDGREDVDREAGGRPRIDDEGRRAGDADLERRSLGEDGLGAQDRKSTRLNSSHNPASRMPSSA
jgi:hypothetical protein